MPGAFKFTTPSELTQKLCTYELDLDNGMRARKVPVRSSSHPRFISSRGIDMELYHLIRSRAEAPGSSGSPVFACMLMRTRPPFKQTSVLPGCSNFKCTQRVVLLMRLHWRRQHAQTCLLIYKNTFMVDYLSTGSNSAPVSISRCDVCVVPIDADQLGGSKSADNALQNQ